MKNKLEVGMKVKFIPKGQKETIEGEVLKLFIGTDKKEYCKIKTETKTYSKQIYSLIWN